MRVFMSLVLLLSILNIYTMERRASSLQAAGSSPWEMAGVSRAREVGASLSFVAVDGRTDVLGTESLDGFLHKCHDEGKVLLVNPEAC